MALKDVLYGMAKNVEPVSRARVVAGIHRKERLLAVGFNQKKSHPLQAKWANHPEKIFLHAEVDAIRNYLYSFTSDSLESCSILVVRMKLNDYGRWSVGTAKPCSGCMRALEFYGLKNVEWT